MPKAKKAVAAKDNSGNKKKKKKKKSKLKRLLKRLLRWLGRVYGFVTDPREKDTKIHPKLMGREITYAGFIIMTIVTVLLIVIVLSNRSVGVEKEELVVTGLSSDWEDYNILVISDLDARSFGQDQSTLMRQLETETYSCVLFLGDMVGTSGNPEPFYALLDQIGTRKPVYFIAGDSDPAPILETPRDNSSSSLTLAQMIYADWVLGAIEKGAEFLDMPVKLTREGSVMWLVPDMYLNLNISEALDLYKDELAQQSESYLEGIELSRETLPLTTYRRNLLFKTRDLLSSITNEDLIIMVSHEVPTDSQLTTAQRAMSAEDSKNFLPCPDVVLAGHYCGGEWKLPILGTIYVNSNILPRYGWFPDESYVQGQRMVNGSLLVYTTPGLGNNGATFFNGRLNNPPRVSLITLTGELPASFFD